MQRGEYARYAADGVDAKGDDAQLPRRLVPVVLDDLGDARAQHDEVVGVIQGPNHGAGDATWRLRGWGGMGVGCGCVGWVRLVASCFLGPVVDVDLLWGGWG